MARGFGGSKECWPEKQFAACKGCGARLRVRWINSRSNLRGKRDSPNWPSASRRSRGKRPGRRKMNDARPWRVIVVGGHTRSIGKTQLVCDLIRAFPGTNWIAGKITQYGHGVCAQNGGNCDCAPDEHICAIDWETRADTCTHSARFLTAGAR